MSKPNAGQYSDGKYYTEQIMEVTGESITLSGTQASATEIYRTRAFSNIKALESELEIISGGTAVGLAFTFNKSLGGTGALEPFGTATFATNADLTVLDVPLTETSIADGDDIVLESVAGTVAGTPVFSVKMGYVENFVCT